MKKNFLVTTGLIDAWEFGEKNFLLGKWCEFYQFNTSSGQKITNEANIIKNKYHWDNEDKEYKDYGYLNKTIEYLLEVISENLSIIHNVKENKEYWRIIIFMWLNQYTAVIFDRWEIIRIFFEKNKNEKFYSNFISLNNLEYLPKNHSDFKEVVMNHEWNHLLYLRLFRFLNIKNLSLIRKESEKTILKKEVFHKVPNVTFVTRLIKSINNKISKYIFEFNKIIFEGYFPKKEFLKICLRYKLIPYKNLNFFNFDVNENNLSKENKRARLKDLLLKTNPQDEFVKFLLMNLHEDIPKSYIENFDTIKRKILPLAKKKKVIFSMHLLHTNDNFKIYIAETKKAGSKYIFVSHGGGLTLRIDPDFSFFEKVSDVKNTNIEKKPSYEHDVEPKASASSFSAELSPTIPVIKLKNSKKGSNCSIIFFEITKYISKFSGGAPKLDQHFELLNEITRFASELNPEIKSKIKFRAKKSSHIWNLFHTNSDKKFSQMFGEKSIDEHTHKNPYIKTILNSRLIIATYPQTAFSEAMYLNIPTILIIKKNHCQLSKAALQTFDDLKKNKIAFEDFNEAKIHINKNWNELENWWKCKDVQSARERFLKIFFNVKPNWYKEWSDYIYFSLFNRTK